MSKPNLPPLPMLPASLPHLGKGDLERIRMWTTAYAEEAVRQALAEAAGKLEDLAQEAFERPGVAGTVHMAYHQALVILLTHKPETRDG